MLPANSLFVISLAVAKYNCEQDCLYWEVVDDQEAPVIEPTVFPIEYGQKIPGRTTRIGARELTPGQFHISGSMGCEDFVPYVTGDFKLETNNSQLEVVNN